MSESALDSVHNSVFDSILPMILRLIALLCVATSVAAEIPMTGLLVDLDPAKDVTLDAQGRVTAWKSQAGPAEAREFVGQPKGRTEPTSGLPSVVKEPRAALSFRQQELVCHDEAAFDGRSGRWLALEQRAGAVTVGGGRGRTHGRGSRGRGCRRRRRAPRSRPVAMT